MTNYINTLISKKKKALNDSVFDETEFSNDKIVYSIYTKGLMNEVVGIDLEIEAQEKDDSKWNVLDCDYYDDNCTDEVPMKDANYRLEYRINEYPTLKVLKNEDLIQEFKAPDYVTAVVHSKQKNEDKQHDMNLFAQGKAHILVATSVIEVGVDVPNASVMIIESAERFGLSQLHQLRGSVGRGSERSFCKIRRAHV